MINGYRYFYNPNHVLANKAGLVYEHIAIAEHMLGREIKSTEVVHHIDGNRSNNEESNLLVFATNGDHARFHRYGCDMNMIYCLPNRSWRIKPEVLKDHCCCDCGMVIDRKAKRCKSCYALYERKVIRPERDELKEQIRKYSFTHIGRKYGVTDNAVRKWCKIYSLPFRVKDISSYSNDDWDKL